MKFVRKATFLPTHGEKFKNRFRGFLGRRKGSSKFKFIWGAIIHPPNEDKIKCLFKGSGCHLFEASPKYFRVLIR